MPIQPVETAAILKYPIYPHTTALDCDTLNLFRKIWKDGVAWQKEQGIEWTAMPELPKILKGNTHRLVLVTDGKRVDTSLFQFDHAFTSTYIRPTHWAYINFPVL